MSAFTPVATKSELDTLDAQEILAGYLSAERGDPEPGLNRGKAFWHGWRNRMMDIHEIPKDEAARKLAHEVVESSHRDRLKASVALDLLGEGAI